MFRLIGRFIAFIFTIIFALLAFFAVVGGMSITSAKTLLTGDYLVQAISNDVDAGQVLNLITGKQTYGEHASLAMIASDKLDEETVKKYNLTEENLEKIMEIDRVSELVSQKLGEAATAATSEGVFVMNSQEVVQALRESEAEFTEITGVALDDEKYEELEQAIADAGVKNIQYDFKEKNITMGQSSDFGKAVQMLREVLSMKLDLLLYAVAAGCFFFIFLFNLSKKRRVFFYSGIVVFGAGVLFTKMGDFLQTALHAVGLNIPGAVDSILEVAFGAAKIVGENAVTIGAALFVAYVVLFVLGIVKGLFFGRR